MIKKWKQFNEAHIGADGTLRNFDKYINSEDLLSDENLNQMIEDFYDNGKDIPEHIYVKLTNRHKVIYMENLIESDGGVIVTNSENETFLSDILNMYRDDLKRILLNYMEMYCTFGNEYLPMSVTFIKNMDEDILLSMVKKLSDNLEYPIIVDKGEFLALPNKVKRFVLKHEYKEENFIGNEDIIKDCFIIDLDI